MAKKRHTAEEIVAKPRQVDVLLARGRAVPDAIGAIGVTEVTYYRWRNEYGGLKGDRKLATSLQHRAATLISGISTART